MADLITPSTFTDRTGYTLNMTQFIQVEGLIADASALVIDIVNNSTTTDDWTTATVPGAIVPVIVEMVRRGLDNPAGYTSEQNSGYMYQGGKTEGILATKEEVRAIRRAAGRSGVGSLNLDAYLTRSRVDGYYWQDDLAL